MARMPKGNTVVCSIVLDDQQPPSSPDESKRMDIDAVSFTDSDNDAVIVDSRVEEYCDGVDDGEASTSAVEVIPDIIDIDKALLVEKMDRRDVDRHATNSSDLVITGAKILKRNLQHYVDSGCPEDKTFVAS